MGENGGGSIVGITANAGRQAFPMTGGFGVACAAVEHFLRMLAVENGPKGVRVNWVRSPGSPDAPGVREAWKLARGRMGHELRRGACALRQGHAAALHHAARAESPMPP